MKKILLFFIVPAIIYAGTVNISIKNHDSESSYTVSSNNAQDLKSKLIFPLNFYSIDFEYKHHFKYLIIALNSSFILNNKTTKGKDYTKKPSFLLKKDWKILISPFSLLLKRER